MFTRFAFLRPLFSIFVLSIYPVLALYGANVAEVSGSVVLRPGLASLVLSIILWGLVWFILRDISKTSIIVGIVLLFIFSYGHLYNFIAGYKLTGFVIGRHLILAPFLLATGILLVYLVVRMEKKNALEVAKAVQIIALTLVLLPLYQIVDFRIKKSQSERSTPESALPARVTDTLADEIRPDIYYIILDMYTRDDILLNPIGYDNTGFLADLRKNGFYVALCSKSNYSQTTLSLASSLNMEYISALGAYTKESNDRTGLEYLVENSATRNYLESIGYQTVSLSAYEPLQLPTADYFFKMDSDTVASTVWLPLVSPFEAMFVRSTAILPFLSLPQIKSLNVVREINYPFYDHIRQQLFILEQIYKIPSLPSPKFVFIHIQIPHPPFVFGPNGDIVADPPPFPSDPSRPTPPERVYQLYRDQVAFINQHILKFTASIESSYYNQGEVQPIVILQGDHGLLLDQREPIFNAYRVPLEQQARLYPSISPVNTFRFILKENFGADLHLLPDISYDSTYTEPFDYKVYQEIRPGCEN